MRRHAHNRVTARVRPLSPNLDRLEARQLLSSVPSTTSGPVALPMFQLGKLVSNPTPPSGAYTPSQIESAYGFSSVAFGSVKGDGTGQTIAIVDAYDDPSIQADLNVFDTQFNLPSTTVSRVNQTGGTSYPSSDSTGGWELEESLDVEWAHAIAPGAKIILVEASSSSDTNLLAGVDYASANANVVSMSWGGSEFSGQTSSSYDGHFTKSGVVYVASSGDNGAPISWPAASPNVLAVGGTSLTLGSGNSYSSEAGWSGSGGGPSAYETQPTYQAGVVTQTTTKRANPDVAYDANPSTGFAVYDSVAYSGTSYGWITIGGTSAGSPQWAALLAIADQGRALSGQSPLDSTSSQEVMTTLYKNATSGDFHDITTGTSTGTTHYNASAGYDYVTGIGSPIANLVIQSLDGTVTPPPPVDTLSISSPTSDVAGMAINVTVTAKNSSGTDGSYTGTVTFSSSDVQAGLPSSYTFTSGDSGSHTFSVTLKTAGSESVTVTDQNKATATASGIAVSPAAASQFILSGLGSTATVGTSQSFTITAKDAYGNVAIGYTGTVQFTSSDSAASLPGSYTFTTSDAGIHSFSVTFGTAGSQSLTVTDPAASGLTVTQSGITVSPAAPINLSASTVSTSQINLSWTGASGATGYTIQTSANGSSGWTTLGSTAAGTTTYQATGLSAGTTYYFRVQATGGSGSAYSNTASATTTGNTTPGTVDTIWSNSYTPNEDEYASGSYEVGVKFQSSVAGTVTGARFYKQTWMGGYTHVGHLWSSSGTLLATATFTNETSYGWEQVNFSTPVSISANTTYIVSFSTGGGYFGITSNTFVSSGVTNGPLTALSNSVAGGDGVYGSSGRFPKTSGGGMNFWADVAFSPTSGSAAVLAKPSLASSAGSSPLTTSVPAVTSSFVVPLTTSTPTRTQSPPVSPRVNTAATLPEELVVIKSSRKAVPQATTLSGFRPGGF